MKKKKIKLYPCHQIHYRVDLGCRCLDRWFASPDIPTCLEFLEFLKSKSCYEVVSFSSESLVDDGLPF